MGKMMKTERASGFRTGREVAKDEERASKHFRTARAIAKKEGKPFSTCWTEGDEMRYRFFKTKERACAYGKKLRRERDIPRDFKPGDKMWLG